MKTLKQLDDTIAAIATPLGEGAVGVVRVSGIAALKIARKIFSKKNSQKIYPRNVYHGWIHCPLTGFRIDNVLLIFMKAPNSYTGEDVIEISCHGSSYILRKLLRIIVNEGARLADRGEFTKRAFLNNKMDLVQAESVLDLIKSNTEESAKSAISQLGGSLSKEIDWIRNQLMELLARMEASIDFPDDIKTNGDWKKRLSVCQKRISELLSTAEAGKILREGISAVIIGRPNVGKSSLLNAFLREERAIVTCIPGTTRDTIEELVNILNIPLRIVDTAGIRHPKDEIEKLGVSRSRIAAQSAGLILLVLDSSQKLKKQDKELLLQNRNKQAIIILNKNDQPEILSRNELQSFINKKNKVISVSALRGSGIKRLEKEIAKFVYYDKLPKGEKVIITNLRHKESLVRAKETIDRMLSVPKNSPLELIVIDLKEAIMALGEIAGKDITEEMLSRIFSEFCVGK